MNQNLRSVIAKFGAEAKVKLSNIAIKGEPEDQLRAPLEGLILDLAELCNINPTQIAAVGETSLSELKTRPDYAITYDNALVGFIEVKAPGKGADPRKFKDKHDKEQWEKLQSIPNLIYTDGNQFSLWRNGELESPVIQLTGDIKTAGAELNAPHSLLALFESFINWNPIPPKDAKQLAEVSAHLCRLLREEVIEQLSLGSETLAGLAVDWRKLLFPEADDAKFADGYAQAVTFGLLMARAKDIQLSIGLDQVAKLLGKTNSLIGSALRLLTDNAENQATLKTSLGTLVRVLDSVNWQTISKGHPDAWLYFYEEFLEIYDNKLRKQTGSYYTPPVVVNAMIQLVNEALITRFSLYNGIASEQVNVADPAVGTGTFLLGVLRQIAYHAEASEGPGSVPAAINAAIKRLIGFEIQLGPFAVAQLRILAEIVDLSREAPDIPLQMFVTDTLSNPYIEEEWIPEILGSIAKSRQEANLIKQKQPITVVIGNPPYKEKAMGRGGWVESGSANSPDPAPLLEWMPPSSWGVSAHTKHLRNLYIYFWRWATWKVFDHHPEAKNGIVCFITVAGFLNGPGFEKMRDYLRRTTEEIWVIDCSPEGHQPEVNTRIFQGVQQPVCIVLASRSPKKKQDVPATVRFRSLPLGNRTLKFDALSELTLDQDSWEECPSEWRSPFLPASTSTWASYPMLEDLFIYNGSGVMPGRTWVIAPDADSLNERWRALIKAPGDQKEALFHPHLNNGKFGDRHTQRIVTKALPGYKPLPKPIAQEKGDCVSPIRYGFRSFDRQWIIPDNRLINRPNPDLWESYSENQVYLTALGRASPSSGPAVTFTGLIPDLDHYKGSFGGRVFPLWRDGEATTPNISPVLLKYLSEQYQMSVTAYDLLAYIAGIMSHPAYVEQFKADLKTPGLRVPLTANSKLFAAAAEIGRKIIWLQTFGERFADPSKNRLPGPPRLPPGSAPKIPVAGAISQEPELMPDSLEYDETNQRLLIGNGYVENVMPQVWNYEVSGKQVLRHWFSYRKADRERPIIGDRRAPSKLGEIQPNHWLAEYTTELINVLNVLAWLVELEPQQAELLNQICSGSIISVDELRHAGIFSTDINRKNKPKSKSSVEQPSLLEQDSDEKLEISIEELEISVRTYNDLRNAGIRTIGELILNSEEELITIKSFRQKSLDEIKDILRGISLNLK